MSLGYLAAVAPDPARQALVNKLAIVLGPAEAEKMVSNLEAVVAKKATEGGAAGATKAVTPLVIKALVGSAAIGLLTLYLSRRRK